MKNEVYLAGHKNKLRHIVSDKTEIRISGQMRDILRRSGDEIVNRDDTKSLSQ